MKKYGKVIIASAAVVVMIAICAVCLAGCDLFGGGSDGSGFGSKTPSSVKVTLDLNGGTGVSQLTVIGKPGDPMSLQSPTRQGFTFDRWYNGYELVDNTVFPNKDITLTARYYCNEDYTETTSCSTTLNKAYGGSRGTLYFEADQFNESKIDYLTNNSNVEVNIVAEFEAICSAIGISQTLGTQASVTLTGASTADAFSRVTVKNYNSYQSYRLTANTTSAKLISSNGRLLNLVYDTTLGSTDCYIRNITITITYTVTAGSMI